MANNIIDILGVNTLALRGLGTEFNKFSRFFKSVAEAQQAVATQDYVPTPGQQNAVLVLGVGIMVYSFDLQDFVGVAELQAASNQASRYIELDGVNDYIEFTSLAGGSEAVLDFDEDWSLGITLVGLGSEVSADQKYVTLASNGTNAVYLRRGGTNWGFYVGTANSNAGANTWYAPGATSRILLVYCKTTHRLKYYLGDPATGVYALRANYLINATMQADNAPSGQLCIGKAVQSGHVTTAVSWDGGVNNLILSNTQMQGPQLDEYFQTGEAISSAEYYADLTTWAKLGEDTYPTVTDQKGNATGGSLVGGAANDFKDVPEA
jgi:hypothetical protein